MTFKLLDGGRLLSIGLGVGLAWACAVSDKGDYTFTDTPANGGTGGASASGGKAGKGGAAGRGSGGRQGEGGSVNQGGESGESGQTGAGHGGQGEGGDGAGGTGGLPPCDTGEKRCDGVCIDVQADNANCGDCDSLCASTHLCVAGTCELDCRTNETLCSDSCVDTNVDPKHCGNCTTACTSAQACNMGTCSLDCGALTNCNGACVDLTSNPGYCGTCETACANNTRCEASACDCGSSGYTGPTCSDDIDECQDNPCQNGGSCRNAAGGYTCGCEGTGYTGTNCEIDVNECNNDPCQNGGACSNSAGTFRCDCTGTGYSGSTCQDDIDECDGDPCLNGGSCSNTAGSFRCDCSGTGYTGANCNVDVNECNNNPCQNGGACDNDPGTYQCDCTGTGYTGTNCQTDINECTSNPCQHGGTCTNTGGSYSCNCAGTGWQGTNCQTDVNECSQNVCQHGGACTNSQGSYSCNCTGTGWQGTNCQTDINECLTNPCTGNSTCSNTAGGYSCPCLPGWNGNTSCNCRGNDPFASGGCALQTVCSQPVNTVPRFSSGNCSTNTAEFADWWCQLGGYERARSYTELTAGSLATLYYNQNHLTANNGEVLSSCTQVIPLASYGHTTTCTGVENLVCQPRPIANTLRSNVLTCGNSSRSVSTLFPSGTTLTSTAGCSPGSATQAMFITRSAAAGSYAGATVRSYLHNGGIVFTEYGVSDDIWNSFITPVVTQSASSFGSCGDDIPQAARFNASDPFWLNNTWTSGQPAGETGCGYPVQAFPNIVPLSGWDVTNVAFAYRNVGMGRLYLTDFDWSDGEALQPYSVTQLGYALTHRR